MGAVVWSVAFLLPGVLKTCFRSVILAPGSSSNELLINPPGNSYKATGPFRVTPGWRVFPVPSRCCKQTGFLIQFGMI